MFSSARAIDHIINVYAHVCFIDLVTGQLDQLCITPVYGPRYICIHTYIYIYLFKVGMSFTIPDATAHSTCSQSMHLTMRASYWRRRTRGVSIYMIIVLRLTSWKGIHRATRSLTEKKKEEEELMCFPVWDTKFSMPSHACRRRNTWLKTHIILYEINWTQFSHDENFLFPPSNDDYFFVWNFWD